MSRVLPVAFAALVSACGGSGMHSEVPVTPPNEVTWARVSGTVVDSSGVPAASAKVVAVESNLSTLTDYQGRYALDVPANSTVTLRAFEPGFGPTLYGPIQLSTGASLTGVDMWLVLNQTLSALNTTVSPDDKRGVLAVSVKSNSATCTPEGATVRLSPVTTAAAMYVAPGEVMPDPNLRAMQLAARPSAWVVGVIPGTYYELSVDKPGCKQVAKPFQASDRVWLEGFKVEAKAVTQVQLFIE